MAKKVQLPIKSKSKPKRVVDGPDKDFGPNYKFLNDFCDEVFYDPDNDMLQCERNKNHKGRHKAFLAWKGYDGIIYEWEDASWDSIDVGKKKGFQGWTD